MLGREVPELMKMIQKEEAQAVAKEKIESSIKARGLFYMSHNL